MIGKFLLQNSVATVKLAFAKLRKELKSLRKEISWTIKA